METWTKGNQLGAPKSPDTSGLNNVVNTADDDNWVEEAEYVEPEKEIILPEEFTVKATKKRKVSDNFDEWSFLGGSNDLVTDEQTSDTPFQIGVNSEQVLRERLLAKIKAKADKESGKTENCSEAPVSNSVFGSPFEN